MPRRGTSQASALAFIKDEAGIEQDLDIEAARSGKLILTGKTPGRWLIIDPETRTSCTVEIRRAS